MSITDRFVLHEVLNKEEAKTWLLSQPGHWEGAYVT